MDMWVPLKEKKKRIKFKTVVGRGRTKIREGEVLIFFLLYSFLSDLRKSDRRISSSKERKVLYATRAMRGYQKHEISLEFM